MVILAASALASCGDDAAPRAAERDDRRGHAADGPGRRDPGGKVATRNHRSEQAADTRGRRGAGTMASHQTGGRDVDGVDAGPAGGGSGPQASAAPAAASACLSDRRGDLDSSGPAPAYVDLVRGCVREQGGVVSVEATAAGVLPPRTEGDNTHASIGFELTPPSGARIFVYADAGSGGWTAHLSRGNEQRELTDALTISGDRLRIDFPSSELGSARQLQWTLSSSWLESTLLSTSYAFDAAPEAGSAGFDR